MGQGDWLRPFGPENFFMLYTTALRRRPCRNPATDRITGGEICQTACRERRNNGTVLHFETPLVTIAIPTYNRAGNYLREAVLCASAQTYQNIEIIVSDNCSTDDTEAVMKGFSDPRIRYYRQNVNIGANNNFNYCLDRARGSYFLLFHDDDSIDPDFIDTCMKSADYRTDVGLIRTGARVIDGKGDTQSECRNMITGSSIEDLFMDWFSGKTPLYLCNSLFNTVKLRELGGFASRTNLYQDVAAEFRLAAKYGRVDVPDVKASFRRHLTNRGSAAKVMDWCEDSLYLLDVMCDLAPSRRDLIRRQGMRYFCRKNYRLASAISSPLRRWITYLRVYRLFDFRYSPIRFVLKSHGRRFRGFMRRKREAVAGA